MVKATDFHCLCLWSSINDARLDDVFKSKFSRCTPSQRLQAMHLIRWCLQGDPSCRPTFDEILSHPFITSHLVTANQDYASLEMQMSAEFVSPDHLTMHGSRTWSTRKIIEDPLETLPPMPARYHFFISHMQAEASGDVGVLYHYFGAQGISCWRDMILKGEITEDAMRDGVRASDAFIAFLTNSSLSRPFVQKEMMWAIEAKIPIVLVAETEERFWAWDVDRWKHNRCVRGQNGAWVEGWLSRTYSQCPDAIKTLIASHIRQGLILPYRRRKFELEALGRKILEQVNASGKVVWGKTTPPDLVLLKLQRSCKLSVCIVHDVESAGMREIAKALSQLLVSVAPCCDVVQTPMDASFNIVLLSKTILRPNSPTLATLCEFSQRNEVSSSFVAFVYINHGEDCWDWSLPSKVDLGDAAKSTQLVSMVCGREAFVWRTARYEQIAMVKNILQRYMYVQRAIALSSLSLPVRLSNAPCS